MFDHFRDKESFIFFRDYDQLFGTLHTFSYEYKSSKILTAVAQGKSVLAIDFQQWVRVEDLNAQEITGYIEESYKI